MGTAFRSDRCIYWHRMVPVVVLLYNGHAWGSLWTICVHATACAMHGSYGIELVGWHPRPPFIVRDGNIS
jgi:hypothetical protein